jgi:hypothetical protein
MQAKLAKLRRELLEPSKGGGGGGGDGALAWQPLPCVLAAPQWPRVARAAVRGARNHARATHDASAAVVACCMLHAACCRF